MRRINGIIADALARGLSSMWLFWFLTVVIFSTLFLQSPIGAQGWILFVVSVFFQGVALPVLAFVSNKQGDRMESLLRETHDATLGALDNLHAMQKELKEMQEDLHTAHRELVTAVGKTLGGERDE